MACLTDSVCDEIQRELTGLAQQWWAGHRSDVRDLGEMQAKLFAIHAKRGYTDAAAEALISGSPRLLLQAMRSTTQSLRDLDEIVDRRAALAESILDLAPSVLMTIGEVLWNRL